MASTNGQKNGSKSAELLQLTPAQAKALVGPPLSNQFTADDRLYRDYTDFNSVYEFPDLDLRAIRDMLSRDGNPRKLEQVLTLPLRGADHEIRGSGPAMDLVRANVEPLIDELIDQCTSACSYRKSFFEVVWKLDGTQVIYDEIAARPAVACEAAFREDSGKADGFRQQLAPITQISDRAVGSMGWVRIPKNRSFIYTYGAHREPLRGTSDMDVSLYCWENIRKLQFLWFQYLEQQSLPKVFVYGDDPGQAMRNAQNVADAHASAAIPVERPSEAAQRAFDVLESSGKGAEQFAAAIGYLEAKQTSSVLASFMDLAQHAAVGGRGSNALSADQSEFFLASRQAIADEMAKQITEGIIKPLVIYNFGPDAEVPTLHIGPIGNRQTDRALDLLKAIVSATVVNAPQEFTGFLINHVATFIGLDSDEVANSVEKWGIEQDLKTKQQDAAALAAQEAAQQAALAPPVPGLPPIATPKPGGPPKPGAPAAGVAPPKGPPVPKALKAPAALGGGTTSGELELGLGLHTALELGVRAWVESLHPRGEHGRFTFSDHTVDDRVGRLEKAIKAATPTDKNKALYDPVAGKWAPERAAQHTEIVDSLYAKADKVPRDGHAIIAGGLGGAGKSTVLGKHLNVGKGDYLTVNPDDIKEEMAKRGMIPTLPGMSPMESAALVHEESSDIAQRLAARARAEKTNMIWDITMSSPGSVISRLGDLDKAGYTHVAGVFVDIPVEDSVKRAMGRYERGLADFQAGKGLGGRFVPPDIIRSNSVEGFSSKNRKTFDSLESRFNATTVFDNRVTPTMVSQRGSITK